MCKELIRFAFEEDRVFRISCGCIKDNVGSEKVMIKCGMTKEAEFESFVWHDGKLKDRVEYRILKNEWKPV
jgi:ribosomal-protein-alanine N-acetyltransferase